MREPDVNAMRRRLEREEFLGWMVAYHELHLDGSGPAALVAHEVYNSLRPLWLSLGEERPPTEPKDHLPKVLIGGKQEEEPPPPDDEDALLAAAARMYG